MLNPLSIVVCTALLAAAGAAAGQAQPQIERQTCELMSREEMQLCLNTQPGDASGARSVRCDQVSRATIEACLQPSQPDQSQPDQSQPDATARAPRRNPQGASDSTRG